MTTTRRLNDSNKVIVTAALTGAVTTKQDNPYLPTQPKEIAEAALRCYEAGAAMVHIHVRDDNDAGSMRFDKFEEAVGLIRATGCPVLLNLTSSGGQGFSWEERIRPFRELRPEMASFDAGTMNWLHSVVFMNEPKFLELCGQEMRAAGVKPEIEVFDMGMRKALFENGRPRCTGPFPALPRCAGRHGGHHGELGLPGQPSARELHLEYLWNRPGCK